MGARWYVRPARSGRRLLQRVAQRALLLVIERRLDDRALVLAHRPDEHAGLAGLGQQEQRRATIRELGLDLLHEAPVHARRRRAADEPADDRAADESDREDEEQQAPEDGAHGGAGLRAARHLVLDVDLAVGVLGHDRGVLEADPAVLLEGTDRTKCAERGLLIGKGDRDEVGHGESPSLGRIEGRGYRTAHVDGHARLARGVTSPRRRRNRRQWRKWRVPVSSIVPPAASTTATAS